MDASKYPFVKPSARQAPSAPSGVKTFILSLFIAFLAIAAAFAVVTLVPSLRKTTYPLIGLHPSDAERWFNLAPVEGDAPAPLSDPKPSTEPSIRPSLEIAQSIWRPVKDAVASGDVKDKPAARIALVQSLRPSDAVRARIDAGELDADAVAELRRFIDLTDAYQDVNDAYALLERRKQYPRMDYDTQAFNILSARSALLTQETQAFGASAGMDVHGLRDCLGLALCDAATLMIDRQLSDARRMVSDSTDSKRLEPVASAYNALAGSDPSRLSAIIDLESRVPSGFVLDSNRKSAIEMLNKDWLDEKAVIASIIEISTLIEAGKREDARVRLADINKIIDANGQSIYQSERFHGLRIDLTARAEK